MKLCFETLEIEDFKSFKKQTFDFGMESGVHFIRGQNKGEPRLGSNGAGKTSLWDALTWCIYGKTSDGLKNTDIVPWGGGKPKVTLRFTIDGDQHSIFRSTSPNKLKLDDVNTSQEEIELLFGLSFDLFTNTLLLGQGQPLFFDLQPRAKLQLFTDVLELDKWDSRSQHASAVVTRLDKDRARFEGEHSAVETNLEQVSKMLQSVADQADEWDSDRSTKLEKAKTELRETIALLEKYEAKLNPAEVAYDGAMMELKAIRAEQPKIQAKLIKARSAKDKIYNDIERWEDKVEELKKELEKLAKTETCPTCGQSITQDDLEEHEQELKEKLTDLEKRIKKGPPREVVDEYVTHQTAYDINAATARNLELKAEEAREVIDRYQPDAASAKSKIASLQQTVDSLEQEDNPYQNQISQLKRNKKKLRRELDDIAADLSDITQEIEMTKFWVKGFKDIRLYVIEEVLQDLELTTQALLDEMGLLDWQVKYMVERETKSGSIKRGINVEIISPHNEEAVKWESWSGGEGQRLRLVGALALSEVLLNYAGVQTDLDILDEPTQRLSVEGVRDLCDFLADRAVRLDRRTFFIDHMSVESARFASVITVVKDEHGTTIST